MSLANDYDNRQQQTIIRGDNFTFPVKMSMFGILPNSPYVKLKCLLIIDKEIIHGSHILYQVLIWVTLFSLILHTERKRVIKYNENTQVLVDRTPIWYPMSWYRPPIYFRLFSYF